MAGRSCNEVHRIWIDEAAGHAISEMERELVESHLTGCEACRIEALAIESLADGRDANLAAALDDLSRRRLIDQAVAQSTLPDDAHDRRDPANGRRQRRTVALAAGLAALVTFGISAGLFALLGDRLSEPAAPKRTPADAEEPLAGTIRLASGDVQQAGETTSSGARLAVGRRLVTDDGRAAIGVESGVELLLEAETELEVTRLDRESISFDLLRGRIVARVDPARNGPPVRISTAAGDVEVTGTAFAVEADGDGVAVQVFRGSVRLAEPNRRSRMLRLGEAAVLGTDGTSALTSAEIAAVEEVLGTLELISDEERQAFVEIKSWPAGAMVAVDEQLLGRTPLAVSVRAGHRRLELSLPGHESVREHLALGRGGRVSRTFELRPAATTSEGAADGLPRARGDQPRGGAQAAETDETGGQPASAKELLEQALALRAAKNWPQAAAAYKELVTRYPGSPRSRAALVSLGRIQLEHLGDARGALRMFDSYLAFTANGTLAQEAAFGRAKAFRRLGLRTQEANALHEFLGRFPTALQGDRARARLQELTGSTH